MNAYLDFEIESEISNRSSYVDDYYDDEVFDAELSILDKVWPILDAAVDKYDPDGDVICGLDVNIDNVVVETISDSDTDKQVASDILNEVRSKLEQVGSKSELELYGDQISGGYPSYDPPEYETFTTDVTSWLNISDKIRFE